MCLDQEYPPPHGDPERGQVCRGRHDHVRQAMGAEPCGLREDDEAGEFRRAGEDLCWVLPPWAPIRTGVPRKE